MREASVIYNISSSCLLDHPSSFTSLVYSGLQNYQFGEKLTLERIE